MAKPASRHGGRSGGKPVFTGMLIGLVLGALLAVGVALWATGNNPFNSAPTQPASDDDAPAPHAPPEAAPSLDFYKVLPSDSPSTLPRATAPAPVKPRFYLQAGAFQNAGDADNLKANLAMLGVEAMIQTGEVSGKGMLHRVRIGPFASMNEVDRTRSLLTQNHIPVTLVRDVPNPQEMP
jgi:cell division protein FtsN